MPFGSFQVSDAEAVTNAIRFVKEAGADAVKLEGAGPSLSRAAAIVGAGHPGDGAHRPHAAVGNRARWVQGPGPHRRRRRAASSTTRARSRRPAASRSCSRPCRRRSPQEITTRLTIPTIGIGAGAGYRRAGARLARPARPLPRALAAFREAVRGPRHDDPRRGLRVRRRRARAAGSPRTVHTYGMSDEELAAFEAARRPPRGGPLRLRERVGSTANAATITAASRSAPTTPRHGSRNVVRSPSATSDERPGGEGEPDPDHDVPSRPGVLPAGAEPVPAVAQHDRRQDDDERQRERDRGERDDLARDPEPAPRRRPPSRRATARVRAGSSPAAP